MVLSLGRMPLANAFLTPDQLVQKEETYPLDVVLCNNCSLLQITKTVPPEKLFREYLYFTSYSTTMLRHAKELVKKLMNLKTFNSKSLVMELGSNDGYLLQYFKEFNVPVLGIEPAKNVAKVSREKGIETICEFFGKRLSRGLRAKGIQADVVIGLNVLAHVADLNGFVSGIANVLKSDGIAVIEVPYVKDLINKCEFDTIYHEHLRYFSLTALDDLFKRHGLVIYDVERVSIHGGSLRLFISFRNKSVKASVKNLLREEAKWVKSHDYYLSFARKVEAIRESLVRLLRNIKRKGKRIAAYGAAAKGTVLLNYCNINKELIDFVVDKSTYKQGRYVPGVRLPIHHPSKLIEEMPRYTLLLVWNIKDEILSEQDEYRRRGGKFIIPIPKVTIT
jgi:SAM-dependent methyltransferase